MFEIIDTWVTLDKGHRNGLDIQYMYIIMYSFILSLLKQIPNATIFNCKYFSSDVSYQAYFLFVSVWGNEVSFR